MAGRVRQPIDVKALEAYIEKNVPEIKTPLDVKQFGFGQSNPTYQLTTPSGERFVLRKKPPGKLVSKTAHKVEREHRVLAALAATDVPVPRTYGLCTDAAVLGTPFYIMSFLDGRVIEDPAMPGAAVTPADRRAMWEDAVRVLARLHRVDRRAVGLESFGAPGGFYPRQLATWATICAAQSAARDADSREPVGQLPHFDDMVAFFGDAARQPADRATLVHGDFKIDNLVFHKTEPRVIGILDWEMATTGHPLSDLTNLLTPYALATLPPTSPLPHSHAAFRSGGSAVPGLPPASDIVALYYREVGWAETDRALAWARAFNMFRLAGIFQGIAARAAARQASSERAATYGAARGAIAELAWRMVGEVDSAGDREAQEAELGKAKL